MEVLPLPLAVNEILEEQLLEEICISKYARNHRIFNQVTREVKELNCKSWRCPRHRKSWLHKWKIVVSRELRVNPVNKLITLTCAEDCTPAQLTLARQLFFEKWRKEYGRIEYLSVLEFTSSTRLPHLHILARATYVQQKKVSACWRYATVGAKIKPSPIVYIERPRSQEAASVYALSYALNGSAKGQDIPDDWKGNKITYSKGFFQSAKVSEHWRNWIIETFGEDKPEHWHIIPKGGAYDDDTYIEKLAKLGLIPGDQGDQGVPPHALDPWHEVAPRHIETRKARNSKGQSGRSEPL